VNGRDEAKNPRGAALSALLAHSPDWGSENVPSVTGSSDRAVIWLTARGSSFRNSLRGRDTTLKAYNRLRFSDLSANSGYVRELLYVGMITTFR
jgi:hypothetical protein